MRMKCVIGMTASDVVSVDLTKSRQFYYKRMVTVTIPIVIQGLFMIGLNLCDTVMIGRLGEVELAATGSANQFFGVFHSFLFGFYSGAGVYAAQYFGAKNLVKIRRILGFDWMLGCGMSLAFFLLIQIMPEKLMGLFAAEGEVIRQGALYLRIVSFSYAATALSFALSYNSRAVQKLTWPTLINISALLVNVLFNFLLIYGPGPFPRLEVAGAAIATVIARLYELAAMTIYIIHDKNHPLNGRLRDLLTPDAPLYQAVLRKALPVLISEVGWSIGSMLVFAVYGRLGYSALAVIQVAAATCLIFQSVIFSFGNGASVVIGETLGMGQVAEAKVHAGRTIRIALAFVALMVAGSLAIMKPVALLYNFSTSTKSLLYTSLTVYAFAMVPRMMAYVLQCGILRAGGDTLFCMITELTSNLGIELSMAYIGVALLQWPLPACIALASLGNLFKMTANYIRYRTGKWAGVIVQKG